MKNPTKTLVELNARLDLVLFNRQEEDHTGRNVAIGVGGLGAVGAGGYALDKYKLQPRMGLIDNNNAPHNRMNPNLSPAEQAASEGFLKKQGRLPGKATRWQAAKSIGEDYAIAGSAGLGKMFPDSTRRLLKDGARGGLLGNIAVGAARTAQALKGKGAH